VADGRRRARGGHLLFVLAAAALVAVAGLAAGGARGGAAAPPAASVAATTIRSVAAYRGLGAWVDLYDNAAWDHSGALVADLTGHGVRTLYVETSNYGWPVGVNRPGALGRILERCHAAHIRVVAWYLPDFAHLVRDYARSKAAIKFRSVGGQRFDSFALDIEASIVRPVSTRTSRLVTLSRRLRALVGDSYPLGGIIPSPYGMSRSATYWPGFPYKRIAAVYDVILPMGYYTYHGDGYANAYDDTRQNVAILRERTGDPAIPIHMIGGVATYSTSTETRAFVRAVRETGCLGASLYDWATSRAANWTEEAAIAAEPRQSPPLPVPLGYADPLGDCPEESTHPREVFVEAPPQTTACTLGFRLYDAQAGEVHLLVNWHDLGAVGPTADGAWGDPQSVAIPLELLRGDRTNVIGFTTGGVVGAWQAWGVRDVSLTPD
jgi:hypothetical protein